MTDSEYRELIARICMSGRSLDAIRDISIYAIKDADRLKDELKLAHAVLSTVRKIANQNIPGDYKNRLETIAAVAGPEPEERNIECD